MPQVTNTGNIPDGTGGTVPVTTITTFPDCAEGEVTLSHEVLLGAQSSDHITIGLVIDVSGSTSNSSGSDLNGDGVTDTFLEAQVFAAKAVFQNYVDLGYDPSRITFTLTSYGSTASSSNFTLNDQAAFEAELDSFTSGGGTNYEAGLQSVYDEWNTLGVDPGGSNQVLFLSDGRPNPGTFTDEATNLANGFNAYISGIGVGASASLTSLNLLDNTGGSIGAADGAVQITDATQLVNILNTPPPIVDVDSVTVEFEYDDPANPGTTVTYSETIPVGDPRLVETSSGYYLLDSVSFDLVPDPAPGTTITADVITNFNNGSNMVSTGDFFVPVCCFTSDSHILTTKGLVQAGDLTVGDSVITRDRGAQTILWINKKTLSPDILNTYPNVRPVLIKKDALGNGMPNADLMVSPQHRIVIKSNVVKNMFKDNIDGVLVAANKLVGMPGIKRINSDNPVTYVHFVTQQHDVIYANGALAETLYLGKFAYSGLSKEQKEELLIIFPELKDCLNSIKPVLPIPLGKKQKQLVARHQKNGKALYATEHS